jgi:DNA-binding transcriptional LysR family regulator
MASDWDDLRFFIELSRAGSVRSTATALGVNHTTVSRRIHKLETRLGTRLFSRSASGVTLTAAGQDLIAGAMQVESSIDALTLAAQGKDERPEGRVTVTSSDALSPYLAPVFARFLARWPHIRLDFRSSQSAVNLDHGEADVAIRFAQQVPEHLIGHIVARPVAQVHGVARFAKIPVEALPFVAWCATFKDTPTEQWTANHVPESRIPMRVNSVPALRDAVDAGCGVGFMAGFMRRAHTPSAPLPQEGLPRIPLSPIWVLTHPELRRTARVRVLMQTLREELPGVLG